MKAAIAILIIAGAVFGAYKVWEYWDKTNENESRVADVNSVLAAYEAMD